MLKVGGIYVSPFEVEGALLSHPDVLEAAVIGQPDDDNLIKPKAYIVIRQGVEANAALAEKLQQHVKSKLAPMLHWPRHPAALAEKLQQHVKSKLAPYKYPRWV